MKYYHYIFILILSTSYSYSQSQSNKDVTISILTCAPGHELYSIYGHNAIRIVNDETGSDRVYNYGTFDFNTPGFAIKFMRGKLPYLLSSVDFYDFMREYEYFHRSVTEQILNLDSLQKQKIIKYISLNMLPENREYKYDFFMDNCATRLRDIINSNVFNINWDRGRTSHKTFRQIIKQYQKGMPWTDFGIDLIIGSPSDKIITLSEEAFIPDYLSDAIQYAEIENNIIRPLQSKKTQILNFDHNNEMSNSIFSPWLLFILLFLLEIVILIKYFRGETTLWVKKYDLIWVILITLGSILLLFMWFGTDHTATGKNFNLLWCSPLIPLIWYLDLYRSEWLRNWMIILLTIILIICMINAIPGIQILKQYFHPLVMVITAILIFKIFRWSKIFKGINV
ncbi:MAG: DUF4105 domain-containing protein [Saprospiraceae bacterium]|nr:DUF4105 domain-containing protein [Saprospiraceae bacterium]